MKTKKLQSKKRFKSSRKRGILVKGEWKSVNVDPSLFADEGLGEIICFEELTDYSLIESEKTATVSHMLQEPLGKKKRKAFKRKASEIAEEPFEEEQEEAAEPLSEDEDQQEVVVVEKPAKKRKKKKKKAKSDTAALKTKGKEEGVEGHSLAEEDDQTPEGSEERTSKPKRKEKQKSAAQVTEPDAQTDPAGKAKKKTKNWTEAALSSSAGRDTDVSAWKDLFVPEPVLKALSKLGFSAPTPIQALALPPAIRDHLDILGAAETGKISHATFLMQYLWCNITT